MAERFLLAVSDNFNMVSSWRDELYCSILKDGSISLRVRKDGDEFRWWFNAMRGIKTPKQFVDAYYRIDEVETDCWSLEDDILPKLFEYFPLFALTTLKYKDIEYEEDDGNLEFFFFSFPLYLGLKLNLGNNFQKAYSLFTKIYNFTKEYFEENQHLPFGSQNVMGEEIIFPKNHTKHNKELNLLKRNQSIERHIRRCEWEKIETKRSSQSFANENRFKLIRKFVDKYLETENRLPIGEFNIDHSRVLFHKS